MHICLSKSPASRDSLVASQQGKGSHSQHPVGPDLLKAKVQFRNPCKGHKLGILLGRVSIGEKQSTCLIYTGIGLVIILMSNGYQVCVAPQHRNIGFWDHLHLQA